MSKHPELAPISVNLAADGWRRRQGGKGVNVKGVRNMEQD